MKTFLISITLFIFISLGTDSFSQERAIDYPDDFIVEYMAEKHIAGMSAVIVIGDSVMWKNHYGYAKVEGDSLLVTDSTLFNIYSISKLITAVCVMQCWENGAIDLDENINGFLPFTVDNYYTDYDSTTARMLMTHSSGIRDYHWSDHTVEGEDPTMTLAYMMENFLSEEGEFYHYNNYLNFVPGEEFEYSNFGIALNGLLPEVLTGEDYKDYSKDSVFTPLDMHQSGWMLNDVDTNNLAAGYYFAFNRYNRYARGGHPAYPGVSGRSTALELSNLLIALMNGGLFNDYELLKSETIDTMSKVYLSDDGYEVGLGMFKMESNGRTIWGHNGGGTGGFASHFFMCPENNSGVVITTNSSHYPTPVLDELFDYASLLTAVSERPVVSNFEVNVFPNPAYKKVTLVIDHADRSDCQITIFDQYGKQVRPAEIVKLNNAKTYLNINVADLQSGTYITRLQIGNEAVTKKIVKL